ncbi:MAG: (Fe-S)-binding protein [Deltaproteobacteria bacterium]|nr:(Fe-S)-binding protein [Deltaproteobacteria bacterium]
MTETNTNAINIEDIQSAMAPHKAKMKLWLRACAHCSLCAESCFLYNTKDNDPVYMPSHKFINSIGKLYKKRGKVDRETLEEIGDIAWNRCVLCTRCYCPFGIDIPEMITLARNICRTQDVYRTYDEE